MARRYRSGGMNHSTSPAEAAAPRRLSVAFALAVGALAVLLILVEHPRGADLALALVAAIGALVYLAVRSVQDLSERRDAYAALKASEERFRALATQSPGGTYEVDIEGMVASANERWREMAGLPDGDFGQGYHLGHPERLETLLGVPAAH